MEHAEELLAKFHHSPAEYPVLAQQTHRVRRGGHIATERIIINENIIHYVQDTALLISVIDGSINGDGVPYDFVVYLDKSARPVSWLVNLFWAEFATKGAFGSPVKRPPHAYVNIDRSPWFRNVGINVTEDGRQKDNGELATYSDFLHHIGNLSKLHLAELRAIFIEGGLDREDADYVLSIPSILDGKRVLVVDEVSRTGSTLKIAVKLFELAFPSASTIKGAYFWHPSEEPLKMGNEDVLTSLPVWYDPSTLTGRGIGGIDVNYYRSRYKEYAALSTENPHIDINKLRAQAFAAPVYSAPLLNPDGTVMSLADEKRTRALCKDLRKLYDDYNNGTLFFAPPLQWAKIGRFSEYVEKQGLKFMSPNLTDAGRAALRDDPLFYLNFLTKLRMM